MKTFLALLTAAFLFTACPAQELVLTPVPHKSAPKEAVNYLKGQKLKPKKAKWSKAPQGIFMADFQKKKQTKTAYYFTAEGTLLYKRVPIQESDLPKEMIDAIGDRMKGPGTLLFLFEGSGVKIYGVSVPTGPGTYITKYFTPTGQLHEMRFK